MSPNEEELRKSGKGKVSKTDNHEQLVNMLIIQPYIINVVEV